MNTSSSALVTRTLLGTLVALGALALVPRDASATPGNEEVVLASKCDVDADCDLFETCDSDRGICACLPGFEEGADGCLDIDECARDLDTCSDDAKCVNQTGSFECACVEGFEGDGVTCVSIDGADGGGAGGGDEAGAAESEADIGADDATSVGDAPQAMAAEGPGAGLQAQGNAELLVANGVEATASAEDALSEDSDVEEEDAAGGLLCSAGPAGGADPSAVATMIAAAAVLFSRRRKA